MDPIRYVGSQSTHTHQGKTNYKLLIDLSAIDLLNMKKKGGDKCVQQPINTQYSIARIIFYPTNSKALMHLCKLILHKHE